MRGRIIAVLAVLVVFAGTACADYKGDLVVTTGGKTIAGKLLLKGDKSRIEFPDQIVIKRPDKGVAWMLSPSKKTYIEMPDKETGRKVAYYENTLHAKHVGTETVNGYPCNKYQFVRPGKAASTTTIWVSDKLNMEMRVISQTSAGSMNMELKNVKSTILFGKTFEIPKGYTKAPAPARVPMRR